MSTKLPRPKLNRQILEEASDWFVEFRAGDVDSTSRERFDFWLRQSPEHIRAYMEIANTYVLLPALSPTRKVNVQDIIDRARSEGKVVPFDQNSRSAAPFFQAAQVTGGSSVATVAKNGRALSRSLTLTLFAWAASVAVVCVTGGYLGWLAVQLHSTYATDIGERRSITLHDGSTIDLNARSRIKVRFSANERDVELLEGQALFSVAHDVSRPFIVSVGTTAVRAVGTQFDVYRKNSGTTVTVVEGRVAVFDHLDFVGKRPDGSAAHNSLSADPSPSGTETSLQSEQGVPATQHSNIGPALSSKYGLQGSGAVFVSAGEQVTVTERAIPVPKLTNVSAATAWTQHQLVFDGSPLSDVVDGFNRYNKRQIVIEDRALDDFHVSGVYASNDPAFLIRFLRQQPTIAVIETNESVRITRK